MTKHRDTPALFELVRSSGIKRPASAPRENPLIPPAPVTSAPSEKPQQNPIHSQKTTKTNAATGAASPAPTDESVALGRTIRLPLGYVFVAVMAMILLLIVAYSVGFARGHAALKSPENAEKATDSRSSGTRNNVNQASVADPANVSENPSPPSKVNSDRSTTNALTNPRALAPARTVDTRVPGLNYIIVERFSLQEADLVADFLAGHGIDVMVLPANNRNLREVIVRQGYNGWLSNAAGQQMFSRIKDLGREWRSRQNGSKNFDKALAKKFGA